MSNKKNSANVQGTNAAQNKSVSKKDSIAKANESIVISSLKQKHNIENRSALSAKQLKELRGKNRRMLIKFANQNFLLKEEKEKLSNAKLFLSYVKNHYQFSSLTFSAFDLYSAKEQKTVQDLQNLIDFCKAQKLVLKVYEKV